MPEPIYAVGDVHGQKAELTRVLDLIDADGGADAPVVFLGDYTDRGPDSRGVLDMLIAGRDAGKRWTFLKGNHDQMFSLFMQQPPQHDPYLLAELSWLHPRLGGDTTLGSYGVEVTGQRRVKDIHADAVVAVPQAHLNFLDDCVLSHQTEEVFFAHAGIRPGVPLAAQTDEDLMWIRKEFHADTVAHPKLIVHGHTPVDEPCHYGNRVNLDTGAGYGKPLAVAVFDGALCHVLTNAGRAPLLPAGTGASGAI